MERASPRLAKLPIGTAVFYKPTRPEFHYNTRYFGKQARITRYPGVTSRIAGCFIEFSSGVILLAHESDIEPAEQTEIGG